MQVIYDTLNRVADVRYPAQHGFGAGLRKLAHHDFDEASRVKGVKFDGLDYASQLAYNAASQTTRSTPDNNFTLGGEIMSGLIEVDEDKFWGVATWAYDGVITRIKNHLPEDAPERLILVLDDALIEPRIISLRELSPGEMEVFIEALKNAYKQAETEGEKAFTSPGYYPSWIKSFRKLVEIVCGRYERNLPDHSS